MAALDGVQVAPVASGFFVTSRADFGVAPHTVQTWGTHARPWHEYLNTGGGTETPAYPSVGQAWPRGQ